MKTIVYIDGFNLYYRCLQKKPQFKWLNLKKLSEEVLGEKSEVIEVKYYTAKVSGKIDADAPKLQKIYLNALNTVPEISAYFGSFQITNKWSGIIHPPKFQPPKNMTPPWPDVVKVRKVEEKGSDVNLGVHLVRDAFLGKYESAVVLSNDTDLCEPIRIVSEELKLPVGLMSPVSKTAGSLKEVASFIKHIRPGHLKKAQFPDKIEVEDGVIQRPSKWQK